MANRRPLTSTEVREIIQTCKDSGVTEFSFRGLKVTFHPGPGEVTAKPLVHDPNGDSQKAAVAAQVLDSKTQKELEELIKAQELSELQLLAPHELEERLAMEDFENDGPSGSYSEDYD